MLLISSMPDSADAPQPGMKSTAAWMSRSEEVVPCGAPPSTCRRIIASPPMRSIVPFAKRRSAFCAMRSTSVAINRNFTLELPQLSTRTFIDLHSNYFTGGAPKRVMDDLLSLAHDLLQMSLIAKTLCVDLVNVLGARGPGGKPATLGHNLQTTYRCSVTRGIGQPRSDRFAGETLCVNRFLRRRAQLRFLF